MWPAQVLVATVALVVWQGAAEAQELSLFDRPWTGSVIRGAGGPPIPLFEGWFPNNDGTHTLCFGYYSMNTDDDVFIPLGPNNRVEPTQYDGLQPDFFERIPEPPFTYRRRYCAFSVLVPPAFGREDRVTWTLLDSGDGRNEPLAAIGSLNRYYRLDELESPGLGDYAPGVKFQPEDDFSRGRNGFLHGPLSTSVGQPLDLHVWVDYPPGDRVWVGWAKHQGPGAVEFSTVSEYIDTAAQPGTTTLTFPTAGEYLIRLQSIANPVTDFEFHCCWTNGFIKVLVD